MKLSKKFVNDYTPLSNVDMTDLADKLLKLGNEYESQGYLCAHEKLVIGKVIECKPHPKSDHLKLCRVDIKSEVLEGETIEQEVTEEIPNEIEENNESND